MSIKLRILLFQVIPGLAVVLMAGLALAAITSLTEKLESVRWARVQLDATTQLEVLANRYSEQIAELLLVGESERTGSMRPSNACSPQWWQRGARRRRAPTREP